jgi:hydroxyethylthiazole kinase-like uncharacterized protein yjeF
MPLPVNLYTAEQTRTLDRIAIDEFGLGGGELMERAGESAYAIVRHRWPRAQKISVVCGPGNNGGDGYVLARMARADGINVQLLSLGDLLKQQGDALEVRKAFEQAGGVVSPFSVTALDEVDLIVDAIFGTGLERDVAGDHAKAIAAINRSGLPVLALDIPSGLHADRGVPLGLAVKATETICFIGLKAGMLMADGPDYCGHLRFNSLAVPDAVYEHVEPLAHRIDETGLKPLFPRRPRNTHKGDNGRVLVVGGGQGMAGAVRMAGEAALYCGAGLVMVATHPDHAHSVNMARPELIVHGLPEATLLPELMRSADVVAIGPGLGSSPWARSLLSVVLESSLPKIVDANALQLLAADRSHDENWILTPHPGEAGALLGISAQAVQQDRFHSAEEIVREYGGVCVLKGAGTIITDSASRFVNTTGNPALATAGTGDLLTGAIAALVAQGASHVDAACAAAWVHGIAADLRAGSGERGWLATEFLSGMRDAIHVLEASNDNA